MPPRDIHALLKYLTDTKEFEKVLSNPITAWGPKSKRMLSPIFLPPRTVGRNQDTIEDIRFRTIAAQDGTRFSPASLVEGGELFGKVHYRLGNSDLARQITGADYEGILQYLNQGASIEAAGRLVGIFRQYMVQALVEHDELANWEAIEFLKITRRGNNGYFEYEDGPDLTNARVVASGDWTDPEFDPWTEDIIPRIKYLVALGYIRSGIRPVVSDLQLQVLAENPFTLSRLVNLTLGSSQTLQEVAPVTTNDDVSRVFTKLGIQAPIVNDLRITTKTGEKRCWSEDSMGFIASTGRSEEVRYNVDGVDKVKIVQDTLGFAAIGVANGQTSGGRRSVSRAYTNQKDSRVEFEGWQSTGPVILEPEAITVITGLTLA